MTLMVAGAYVLLCLWLRNLPFQDAANHLARATVMADALFDHGTRFGQWFTVTLSATPYVLGDLVLAVLVKLTGPSIAGPLWNTLVFAALPVSLAYFARSLGLSWLAASMAFLLGCLDGSDWYFLMGYQSFQLAVALSVVVAGNMIRQCDDPSSQRFVAIIVMIICGYLVHLTTVLFVGTMAGVIALAHTAPLGRRVRATGLPLVLCAVLLVSNMQQPALASGPPGHHWELVWKGSRVLAPWLRFNDVSNLLLIAAFSGVALLGLWNWKGVARDPRCWLLAASAGAFFVMWSALPPDLGSVSYVDVRALEPMSCCFLLLVLLPIDLGPLRVKVVAWVASACIAAANLCVLGIDLFPADARIGMYRELLRVVPEGATVFPVSAARPEKKIWRFLHAGAWATTDRFAMTPYLFSGSINSPMEYFRYVRLPQVPSEFWPIRPHPPALDCDSIAQQFQYVAMIDKRDLGCANFVSVATSADGSMSILRRVDRETGAGVEPSASR